MELIPCASCGQAVGNYRAACPFCGASTGRPEGAPPPVEAALAPAVRTSPTTPVHTPARSQAPRRPITRHQWVAIIVGIVIVLSIVVMVTDPWHTKDNGLKPTDPKDVKTVALISDATDRLTQITQDFTAGNTAAAAEGWKTITAIYPRTDNTYVLVLSNDYVDYANAVRYYLLGQGSLPDAEDAQAKVEGDLLAMQ